MLKQISCDEFLYLGGNEQSTHKYISELLGKETIDTNSYGRSFGSHGNFSENDQIAGRELLTPDEVRLLDNNYALLFIRGKKIQYCANAAKKENREVYFKVIEMLKKEKKKKEKKSKIIREAELQTKKHPINKSFVKYGISQLDLQLAQRVNDDSLLNKVVRIFVLSIFPFLRRFILF